MHGHTYIKQKAVKAPRTPTDGVNDSSFPRYRNAAVFLIQFMLPTELSTRTKRIKIMNFRRPSS